VDVILDTNVFESDFCMRKNQFANLFDYLRRTDSMLVICKVVWDEVMAHYAERIKGDIDRVKAAWKKLDESRLTSTYELDLPNRDSEVQYFQNKLRNPAKGVKVAVYDDYSRININEIARRGIKRIRPASDSGEELRDVILWLHALDYAKEKSVEIAFVSYDPGFIEGTAQDKEEKGKKKSQKVEKPQDEDSDKDYKLHPHLQEDIAEYGVKVRFYRLLSSFNKENSPSAFAASEEWLKRLGTRDSTKQKVEELVSAWLLQGQRYRERIIEVSLASLQFLDGTVYEINESTQFAELDFKAEVKLVLEEPSSGLTPNMAMMETEFIPLRTQSLRAPISIVGNVFSSPEFWASSSAPVGVRPMIFSPSGEKTRHTTLKADIRISVRWKGDKLTGFEIERFSFEPSDDPLLGFATYNWKFSS
jgi:hypothetical protein